MGKVKGQCHLDSAYSGQFISLPRLSKQTIHSGNSAILKFELEYPKCNAKAIVEVKDHNVS